jgi:CobW/HypB/UreG family nucleotide-binding protein
MARLVLVNGFLGAGKTTALIALADAIRARGQRPGIITNDQSATLVDSLIARNHGLPAAEVAGGCFCCRFSDLIVAIDRVLACGVDFVLCEAVGSCTDVVATVIEPLRRFYTDVVELSPVSVVVDVTTVDRRLNADDDLGYIFRKQIEEADVVVLNKIDASASRPPAFTGKRVLRVSAKRGDGISEWLDVITGTPTTSTPLPSLDYDRYASGEAMLAWLNARATTGCDASELLQSFRASLGSRSIEVAHLKFTVGGKRIQLTSLDGPVSMDDEPGEELIVNVRARTTPAALREAVTEAIHAVSAAIEIRDLEAFSPSYPRPHFCFRDVIP